MRATPWQYPIASANINVWSSSFASQLWLARGITVQHVQLPIFSHSCCEGSRQWVNRLEDVGGKACRAETETLMLDDVLKESPVWVLFLVSEAELGKWLNWLKLACWKMEPASGSRIKMWSTWPWHAHHTYTHKKSKYQSEPKQGNRSPCRRYYLEIYIEQIRSLWMKRF